MIHVCANAEAVGRATRSGSGLAGVVLLWGEEFNGTKNRMKLPARQLTSQWRYGIPLLRLGLPVHATIGMTGQFTLDY